MHAFGSRGVLRLVRRVRPDVIVSVYPMTTEVLGKLRRTGRLDVPVVAAITDLAAMHYWAAPGIDLHLVIHPESIEEVREVAGEDSDVRVVHGLTRPEFAKPCDPLVARAALGLPADGKVVLVSGGGWGVGDLESAVDAALGSERHRRRLPVRTQRGAARAGCARAMPARIGCAWSASRNR